MLIIFLKLIVTVTFIPLSVMLVFALIRTRARVNQINAAVIVEKKKISGYFKELQAWFEKIESAIRRLHETESGYTIILFRLAKFFLVWGFLRKKKRRSMIC